MTKAFAYLRVSGKGQIVGDGFPRQEAAVRAYAKRHRVDIVRIFREKGVAGPTDLENRPALLQLMEALAANGVKLVLIERLDRLARDLMVQETIIGDMRKRGFELVSVTEPNLLQDDATRILMRQIFGAIAQYDKAMIVAKLRAARQRMKAKTGRCERRKPYGETEAERAGIERMRQMRVSGMSYRAIADALTAEGVPARLAQRWHTTQVQRILAS